MKNQRPGTVAGRERFRLSAALIPLLLFFVTAAPLPAVTLDGSSRSYFTTGQSISAANLRPGYEYLDLSLGDLGNQQLSMHFGGWARYDFKEQTATSDLQYAYLSFRSTANNAVVNVGRTLVFEGVAAERIDGAYARTDLAGNFGLSVFGGVPAETNIETPGNNLIYGARISHQTPDLYRIGISALKEEKNSEKFREEAGVDLWLRPIEKVELLGRSTYDAVSHDWMEHSYDLVLGPFDKVRFVTEASRYLYAPLFRTTTNNAFVFGSGLLDPAEKVFSLGEEISFAVTDQVTVYANYRFYNYRIAGDAKSFGGRVNYARGKDTAAGFSVMRMDGDSDRLRYTQYRLYAAHTVGKLDLAVDLIDLVFDGAASGTNNSYSATLAVGYELGRSLKIGADVEYRTSPVVDRDVLFFAKLIYRFGFKAGGGV